MFAWLGLILVGLVLPVSRKLERRRERSALTAAFMPATGRRVEEPNG